MEFFALFEMCGCFLEGVNGLALLADLFAWLFSAPNRQERREAKRAGKTPPPRSGWTWAAIVLTVVVVVLTVLILVKYLAPRPGR